MAQGVEDRITDRGFAVGGWVAELDVRFARLYFGALRSALAGERSPGCWRSLFVRRNLAGVPRLQFALAGINAHINHDLPQAIFATCEAMATAPQHARVQYRDYTTINGRSMR